MLLCCNYAAYILNSIIKGPDGMAEWVERLSPVLVDRGISTDAFETWSSQTNE